MRDHCLIFITSRTTEAKIRVIAVEADKTLLLERDVIVNLANRSKISVLARLSSQD